MCEELRIFVAGGLPHKHKIVIAGNHELSFDTNFVSLFKKSFGHTSRHTGCNLDEEILRKEGSFLDVFRRTEKEVSSEETTENIKGAATIDNIRQYLKNCIYLEDSGIQLYGISIYGSPW